MLSYDEARWLRGDAVHGKVLTSPFLRLGHLFDRVAIGASQLQQCMHHSAQAVHPNFSVIDVIGGPPDVMKATLDTVVQLLATHRGVVRCLDLRGCTRDEQLREICEAVCGNAEIVVQGLKVEMRATKEKCMTAVIETLRKTRPLYLGLHRLPGRSPMLASMLQPITASCHTLVLKECTLTSEDVDSLNRFIDEATSLKALTLSQVAARPWERLLEVIGHALQKPSIQALDLSNNRLSSHEIRAIADFALEFAAQREFGLKALYMDRNAIDDTDVWHTLGFLCATLVPKMSAEECRLDDDGLNAFVGGILGLNTESYAQPTVRHSEPLELNFSSNRIVWNSEMTIPTNVFERIKTLLLNHNSSLQLQQLAGHLAYCTNLERLELKNTGLSTGETMELMQVLAQCWQNREAGQYSPPLRYLNLDGTALGFQGATALANIIRSRQHPLQFISIAQCHIGDLGQTALADALAEDNQMVWLDTGASDTASLPATKVLGTVPASLDTKLAFVEVVAHRRKEGKQALGQDVLQVIFDFLRVPVRRHVR